MMAPSQTLLLVIVSCSLSLVDVGFLVIPCVSCVGFAFFIWEYTYVSYLLREI